MLHTSRLSISILVGVMISMVVAGIFNYLFMTQYDDIMVGSPEWDEYREQSSTRSIVVLTSLVGTTFAIYHLGRSRGNVDLTLDDLIANKMRGPPPF